MPKPNVQASVTLFGSPPWGFRLSGGKEFNQPLVISRVTPGSVSSKSGLTPGDVLVAINGQFVAEMTQDQAEAKVKQAIGSLYLVVEKDAAKVTQLPSGEVALEADRSVYTADLTEQERISRHNRTAKPFAAYSEASPKPSGFRSVKFQPKVKQGNDSSRGQPDGGSSGAAETNQPKPVATDSNADESNGNLTSGRKVLGPNAAVGLYSNANVQQTYNAQVGGAK